MYNTDNGSSIMYDAEMFEIMIDNWLADNAEEMADLEIDGENRINEDGNWERSAHDTDNDYVLIGGTDGNITIEYVGTR